MRKTVLALLAAATMTTALLNAIAPASAAAPTPKSQDKKVSISYHADGTVTTKIDGKVVSSAKSFGADAVTAGPFMGHRFRARSICLLDKAGTTWPIGQAGNAFESGTATVLTGYRSAAQGCNDFAADQRLTFYTYKVEDNACFTVTGTVTPAPGGGGPGYSVLWSGDDGGPAIFMNLWYYATGGCRDTAQHRSYQVSQAIGSVLGLAPFHNTTTSSIMNLYFADTYNLAGAFDRNNLAYLY